ncbi:uncharacterized protein Asalp_27460 [Aeromonas salmonicida subsp. pectinolytica 34mel]|uniref:Uncharacterized protein n=1 Tax=Aeromonas salmonicida subsp. pectinolytica 34mel TaxID=1324960 RepID=A0A2D1QHL2_AERSA|nr:uncharacterized protein Asalp_27460 [Aeromonas salmonicida subsp. pectinolytica 34mel]
MSLEMNPRLILLKLQIMQMHKDIEITKLKLLM